jgi:serine/threonine protein kinase
VKSKGPDWWVKIGDFGISKRAEEGLTALRTLNGTPGFLAPELLAQFGLFDDSDFDMSEEYTVAVDIWSLGEIVFRALTGTQAFPKSSLGAYIKGTSSFPVDVLHAHGVSGEGCDILKGLMAPIPKDRLTADEALRHKWIGPQTPSSARSSAEMQRYLFLMVTR